MPSSPRGHPTSKFVCEIQNQHDLVLRLGRLRRFDGRDHQQALVIGSETPIRRTDMVEMVEPHTRRFRGKRVALRRVTRSHDPGARSIEQIMPIPRPVAARPPRSRSATFLLCPGKGERFGAYTSMVSDSLDV